MFYPPRSISNSTMTLKHQDDEELHLVKFTCRRFSIFGGGRMTGGRAISRRRQFSSSTDRIDLGWGGGWQSLRRGYRGLGQRLQLVNPRTEIGLTFCLKQDLGGWLCLTAENVFSFGVVVGDFHARLWQDYWRHLLKAQLIILKIRKVGHTHKL